jgi:hypothetical protein
MQHKGTNELIAGDSIEELKEMIPEKDQGPTFRLNEIVPIKGYNYRVTGIKRNRLFFKPHGPIK